MKILICEYCKDSFSPKNRNNNQRFCNRNCYIKGIKGENNKGRFKKGSIPWNKGLLDWCKKYNNAGFQKGHKRLVLYYPKGVHYSIDTEFKKGNKPWNTGLHGVMVAWNKGMGQNRTERMIAMGTWRYINWRNKVFKRDNYTCRICGVRGGKLIADHIKMWALFPKLRYSLKNGQTLCKRCSLEKTRKELSIYWKNQYKVSKELALLYSGAKASLGK